MQNDDEVLALVARNGQKFRFAVELLNQFISASDQQDEQVRLRMYDGMAQLTRNQMNKGRLS